MKAYSVRLAGINIKNFKNVVEGYLSFDNPRKNYKASILGLYGQNGSGKTALIDALELLKNVLCGRQVPDKFADYINLDSEQAELQFEFLMEDKDERQTVFYSFVMKRETENTTQNIEVAGAKEPVKKVRIFDEVIKCSIISNDVQTKMGRLLDSSGPETLTPKAKRLLMVGKRMDTDLVVCKKLAYAQGRSFLFSPELFNILQSRAESNELSASETAEFDFYWSLIYSLVFFGNCCLFVVNTSTSGMISLNAQPLMFRYKEENTRSLGTIMLPLDEPVLIPEHEKQMAEKVIRNMNTVLTAIVPGLTVTIRDLGSQVLDNGDTGIRIQMMSSRNGREIPLKYESEGIKKIVSILQLLIVVYNQSSITVAIDELDSGVFEYLLGELVRIISEKGKGQLIFTSHNLRPLETLDRGFVAFTTTNPKKRYVRMTNVKDSNNLRDYYYRDIMLSENHDNLYEQTKNSEIAFAFREAGGYSGS